MPVATPSTTDGEPAPGPAAVVAIKAVPGASRDAIAGVLGGRLKVRVSAPPEGGRANRAICRLLARELGVRPAQVEIVAGHGSPEKRALVRGVDAAAINARWPPAA